MNIVWATVNETIHPFFHVHYVCVVLTAKPSFTDAFQPRKNLIGGVTEFQLSSMTVSDAWTATFWIQKYPLHNINIYYNIF